MSELRILGSLQAIAEGEPLGMGGRQQRAVPALELTPEERSKFSVG
jgi:hypothetical protein